MLRAVQSPVRRLPRFSSLLLCALLGCDSSRAATTPQLAAPTKHPVAAPATARCGINFAHAWQVAVPSVGGQPRTDAQGNYVDAQGNISWNQEKMFQAATLVNQREYQHVAIDQYARLVSPNIPLFVMYDTSVNADVSLEYSQAAFRFGHSVLRDVIDTLDPNGSLTAAVTHYSLEQAFLTPSGFAKVGPAAIVQGMAQQVGAEIDEFVTPALQQKLLGQPQDLAAINIARGRDLGMPTLNRLREQLSGGMATQLALLQQKQTEYQLTHGFADPIRSSAIRGENKVALLQGARILRVEEDRRVGDRAPVVLARRQLVPVADAHPVPRLVSLRPAVRAELVDESSGADSDSLL